VAAGEWQPLIVAEHSRRVISLQGDGTINNFTPTKAIAVDAQAPQTVRSIPVRAFSPTIMGEPGVLYLCGGLHSNYQGNEIDRMTLPPPTSTTVFTELSHQPAIPPEGADSGYASGSGGYVWRMYGDRMSDPTQWQPFPGHQWTKQSYHPHFGFFSVTPFAKGDGSVTTTGGHPVPTGYNAFGNRVMGGVAFNWRTGKYVTFFDNEKTDFRDAFLAETGMSDWSAWTQSMLALHNVRSETFMNAVQIDGRVSRVGATYEIGGFDRSSGNGVLVRHLQMGQYLMLRQDGNGSFAERTNLVLWSPHFNGAKFVRLTIPAAEVADVGRDVDAITFCVDRNSRRVFWMVFPNPGVDIRFYVSSFEDLMRWRRIEFVNRLRVPEGPYQDSYLASDRTPMHFLNGYLILNSKALIVGAPALAAPTEDYINGAITLLRVKVDGGEDLPPMNFKRFDYRDQGFRFSSGNGELQLAGTKHVNWAYRPVDGTFYMCAGDAGASFTQSTAKLKLNDGTTRGYTFTQLLDETSGIPQTGAAAAAGYKHRPYSPDDGAWVYLGANNNNPELADKFLWARGGDGAGFSSNTYTRPVYRAFAENKANWDGGNDTGSPGAVARMKAEGWTGDKFLLFDVAFNAFKETNTADWAYDSGGEPLQHPTLQGSAASRNGVWDPTTNTLWRFVDYNNTLTLCSYDFDNRRVRLFKVNVWVDDTGRTWFTDGTQPEQNSNLLTVNGLPEFGWFDSGAGRHRTAAANPWSHKELWLDRRDGKIYIVSASTGYLWCFETRGPVTRSVGGGNTIPFYPVGQRIQLTGTYPATDSREYYPPRKYFEAGFRVGADTRMNSFIAPFKGGLLWWSSCHHEGGTFGRPLYAFWRRLGYTGEWTVVTLPTEFVANSLAPESLNIDNPAILAISAAGNPYDTPTVWPWFWRIS
jgi:hypothetical protein